MLYRASHPIVVKVRQQNSKVVRWRRGGMPWSHDTQVFHARAISPAHSPRPPGSLSLCRTVPSAR